ncbi:hypothetical protein Tco_1499256 [Tanacetum coccineum]
MANVLSSMGAANILASGGLKEVFTTASPPVPLELEDEFAQKIKAKRTKLCKDKIELITELAKYHPEKSWLDGRHKDLKA